MASINKEFLIEMLIPYPKNDLDKGYNAAIIQILKIGTLMSKGESDEGINTTIKPQDLAPDSLADGPTSEQLDLLLSGFLSTGLNKNWYLSVKGNNKELLEYFDFMKSGNKLAAVKLLKEIAGLGLKEAKDVTDYISNKL